jgi:hypothetical protein
MSIFVPAYGRDYKSKAEILAAWNAGKDFADPSPFASGTYLNREDAEREGMREVLIRYKRLTAIAKLTHVKRVKNGVKEDYWK